MQIKSVDELIRRFSLVHGDRYDYSMIEEYPSRLHPLPIVCRLHGVFYVSAKNHLATCGCSKCHYVAVKKSLLNTRELFITGAMRVHGDLYDYSNVIYNGNKEKVEIICSIHGSFYQTPCNHVSLKQGCSKCYGNTKYTTQTFIDAAVNIHGDLYDYSDTKYVNSATKVVIGCRKHGPFEQRPSSHLRKHGCSKCKSSIGESVVRNFLIRNDIKFEEQKMFDCCVGNKRRLPFDFWVPAKSVLIEYDGEQHYKPKFGDDSFKKTLENDSKKTCFCNDNKLYLLRIKYDDNIEQCLGDVLL